MRLITDGKKWAILSEDKHGIRLWSYCKEGSYWSDYDSSECWTDKETARTYFNKLNKKMNSRPSALPTSSYGTIAPRKTDTFEIVLFLMLFFGIGFVFALFGFAIGSQR
jgi:hypothetical protein